MYSVFIVFMVFEFAWGVRIENNCNEIPIISPKNETDRYLQSNELTGTLPSEWANLSALLKMWVQCHPIYCLDHRDCNVWNNAGVIYGGLWSANLSLAILLTGGGIACLLNFVVFRRLQGNKISGSLPPAWSLLTKIEEMWVPQCHLPH
jgi:hypothetical protein